MLDMFTRGLLERKYAGMEEENRIRQQQTTSLGLLQAAQAKNFNVAAGLAPKTAEADIAFKDANTQTVLAGNPFVAPRAQADIDAVRSGIGLTNANAAGQLERNRFIAPLAQTEIGLGRANIGNIGANTRATNLLSRFSKVSADDAGRAISGLLRPSQQPRTLFGGMLY